MAAPVLEWPDVQAAVCDYLRPELATPYPGTTVTGGAPGQDLDSEAIHVQVEVDDIDETFPVLRDTLVRLTVYNTNRDTARDVAEYARGALLALAYNVHPVLRVGDGENGTAPLYAVDTVSDRPMCSVLVRVQTRPAVAG